MTALQIEELHKLSPNEKIELAQLLWEDLANEQSLTGLPLEHQQILENRLELINTGIGKFISWEDYKSKYDTKR